jgi:hypothetical protein
MSSRRPADIDVLGREVREAASRTSVYETIEVLAKKWPAKKDQVEIELRKVLAELGLLGKSPDRPKPSQESRETA